MTRNSKYLTLLIFCGFLCITCSKEPIEKSISGTVTADASGKVEFFYSRQSSHSPAMCSVETNLPAPNQRFDLQIISGSSSERKIIEGLQPNQKVSWTAKVKGRPMNHGSENFVHIINE